MEPPLTFFISLVAMLSSLAAAEQHQRHPFAPRPPLLPYKRDTSVCEQTYGSGSVPCGDAKATMCYNPSIGQSCCADNGYCDRGQYCAPVPGYCCLDSEDLQTCATNAGFQLPPSVLAANTSTTVAGPTAAGARPAVSTATGTGGGAPQVQVSAVARKEQWTLVWMTMGIGIVGVIMATF